MKYPTLEAVAGATRYTLCYWHRFLPSPGLRALDGGFEFNAVMTQEAKILQAIEARLKELGGFSPEISKAIGWSEYESADHQGGGK